MPRQLSMHLEKSQTKLGCWSGKLSQPFQYSLGCILRTQTDFKFKYIKWLLKLCWFWDEPKGYNRAPKGHSTHWKRTSENSGGSRMHEQSSSKPKRGARSTCVYEWDRNILHLWKKPSITLEINICQPCSQAPPSFPSLAVRKSSFYLFAWGEPRNKVNHLLHKKKLPLCGKSCAPNAM